MNMNDAQLIWQWQRCEGLAKKQKVDLVSNGQEFIFIIDHGKFLYNAKTVEAVHAFLTAKEQSAA